VDIGEAAMTRQHTGGHAWRYDSEEFAGGMVVHFQDSQEAIDAGFCGCSCGVCRPNELHALDDGCTCRLFGCVCLDADRT
jgi:hypothetical protein